MSAAILPGENLVGNDDHSVVSANLLLCLEGICAADYIVPGGHRLPQSPLPPLRLQPFSNTCGIHEGTQAWNTPESYQSNSVIPRVPNIHVTRALLAPITRPSNANQRSDASVTRATAIIMIGVCIKIHTAKYRSLNAFRVTVDTGGDDAALNLFSPTPIATINPSHQKARHKDTGTKISIAERFSPFITAVIAPAVERNNSADK